MITKEVKISNAIGLFIQKANTYNSTIWVEKDDRRVNAKSLLGVLSLGIAKGMTIVLTAEGQDEELAIEGLTKLIDTGFEEQLF